MGIVLTDMSPCNDGCLPPGGSVPHSWESELPNRLGASWLASWGGGRGGCDTRCSPRLAIRDAGLQWGNERELREPVANHEVEVVCVLAGASESSFAGFAGMARWVPSVLGQPRNRPGSSFFREWSWAACAAEGADVPAPAGMGGIAAV